MTGLQVVRGLSLLRQMHNYFDNVYFIFVPPSEYFITGQNVISHLIFTTCNSSQLGFTVFTMASETQTEISQLLDELS